MREPILIKRYNGARLYDTVKACYVSLDELRAWQARGIPFEVRDAETGQDDMPATPERIWRAIHSAQGG